MYRADISVGLERDVTNPNSRTFEEREKELKAIEAEKEKQRKREKKSPFRKFVQYNLEWTEQVIWLTMNHPKAAALLLFITDQMDRTNALTCTYAVLEDALGISESTIKRNIKVLKNNGYLKVLRNGTSNVYHINSNLYWKNYGNRKWQAKLTGTILMSLREQDKETQKRVMDGDVVEIPSTGEKFIADKATGEAISV